MTAKQRTAMYKRLEAKGFYRDYRKEGQTHKEALESLKFEKMPTSHITKSNDSPFKSERK